MSSCCHGNFVFWTGNWKHVIKYDLYIKFPRIFAYSVQICAKFCCKNFNDVAVFFRVHGSAVNPEKTAEPLEMPYGSGLWWGQGTMLDGGSDPPWEGAMLSGRACLRQNCDVNCANTAKPIEMPVGYGLATQVSIRWGSRSPCEGATFRGKDIPGHARWHCCEVSCAITAEPIEIRLGFGLGWVEQTMSRYAHAK